MLKIENIKLPPGAGMAELTAEAARLLRVKEFVSLRVLRRSIDARDGVQLVYTVEAIVKDEAAVLRRCRSRKVSRMERPKLYALPDPISPPEIPPVVVGAGPGGLFAESFACARAESLPVTVTAAADAAVLLIDCGRISAPCSAACTFHTRLISNLLQVLAEKNLSLAGKLGHLSGRTIRERLLSYLEEQAARTGRATVTVPFDRQALADYLCVDRSALSRTIGALQREGVLTVRRDRFTLNF